MTARQIVAEALKLKRNDRARLASRLIQSLDEEEKTLSPAECEKLWLEESERRLSEWGEGKVKGIPGEEVFARARALRSA